MVTAHVGVVPVQAPPHPTNRRPLAGVAVRVTAVFRGYCALQVGLQLMPAGSLITVPCPCTLTLRRTPEVVVVVTVVLVVAALFAGSGSVSVPPTLAVLVSVPDAVGWT